MNTACFCGTYRFVVVAPGIHKDLLNM